MDHIGILAHGQKLDAKAAIEHIDAGHLDDAKRVLSRIGVYAERIEERSVEIGKMAAKLKDWTS